jgi:hypothetical protein
MRIQTLAYYVAREIRDAVEFVLLPGLALVLPWPWCYRLFRRAARWNWLFRRYCRGAYEQASQFLDIPDEREWRQRNRLLWLLDAAEYYLVRFRPGALMKEGRFEVVGDWPREGHFIAVGLHWGLGGLMFRDLNRKGHLPRLIFKRNVLGFAEQSRVENLYRRWRPRQYAKVGGGEPISTGGGFAKIVQMLDDKDVLIIVYDAPLMPNSRPVPATVLGRPARLRSGTIRILAESDVDYVKYRLGYDFETGKRRLEISEPVNVHDQQAIVADLEEFLDDTLRLDSTQWYLWRQAQSFFVAEPESP